MNAPHASWLDLPHSADTRGVLTYLESGLGVPFQVQRVFFLHHVQGERGGHAHRDTTQLLVPVAGAFSVDVCGGDAAVAFRVDDPNRGLLVPPMHWVRLYDFSPGAVCLVLADRLFADSQYLRDWSEFVAETAIGQVPTGSA